MNALQQHTQLVNFKNIKLLFDFIVLCLDKLTFKFSSKLVQNMFALDYRIFPSLDDIWALFLCFLGDTL